MLPDATVQWLDPLLSHEPRVQSIHDSGSVMSTTYSNGHIGRSVTHLVYSMDAESFNQGNVGIFADLVC